MSIQECHHHYYCHFIGIGTTTLIRLFVLLLFLLIVQTNFIHILATNVAQQQQSSSPSLKFLDGIINESGDEEGEEVHLLADANEDDNAEGDRLGVMTSQKRKINDIRRKSCEVFDPFRVLPAEAKHFQLGGAFPLHKADCLELNPSSVQDVVAIQWALAYWNEQTNSTQSDVNNPNGQQQSFRPKVGLFAGDSCTRPKEAIAQSLRFLDTFGFNEPTECLANKNDGQHFENGAESRTRMPEAKLIGILAPKDRESADSVAQTLRSNSVPVGVYSSAAAQAFLDANVQGFITTVPLLADYVRALVEMLKMLNGSDLISIVDYWDGYPITQKLVEQLNAHGISVAEFIPFEHPLLANILSNSDAQIIVSLVSNKELADTGIGQNPVFREMRKLWITLDFGTDEFNGVDKGQQQQKTNEMLMDFLEEDESHKKITKLQFITIQRQQRYLADFNAYFLRVLLNNFEHYSLLNAYMQHVYNCSLSAHSKLSTMQQGMKKANCSEEQLQSKRLMQFHKQSTTLEAAILLIYALARTAKRVEANEQLSKICLIPSFDCFDGIRAELLKLSSTATDPNDASLGRRLPPGFKDQLRNMHFFETSEGAIQLAGIPLEAMLTEKEGRDGGSLYRLLFYRTGRNEKTQQYGVVEKFNLPQKLRHLNSKCRSYRPYCVHKCEQTSKRRDDQTFLSIPHHFSLYLTGMFDFQSGPNCDQLRRDNPAAVALPLAFVHSMSTFHLRFSPKSQLFQSPALASSSTPPPIDIGTMLIDTCSNARTLMEFLVDSEKKCYKFTQVERNWTIASGSTIGYLYGSDQIGSTESGVLRAMFSSPSAGPVLTIANGNAGGEMINEEDINALFSFGPSHRAMAAALVKFLRKMHWAYVNVVLDRSDPDSVSIHRHFEQLSADSICIGDLTVVGKQKQTTKTKRSAPSKQHGIGENLERQQKQQHFGDVAAPSANVTLVFSSAKLAAEYMSARLRDEFMGTGFTPNVHVMVDNAHDFYLHDPTNLAQYAGTVSFQAKDVISPEFHSWIRSITPLTLPEVWYWRHVEENWHCALSRSNIPRFDGRMCTGEELLDVNGMGRLTKAGYLAKGVEQLLIAIDETHKKLCPNEKLCDNFVENGRKLIRELLVKMVQEDADAFEVYQWIPTSHNDHFDYKLFANFTSSPIVHSSTLPTQQQLTNNNKSKQPKRQTNQQQQQSFGGQFYFLADYRPFGVYSDQRDDESVKKPVISRCRAPFCKCPSVNKNSFGPINEADMSLELSQSSYIRREPARISINGQQPDDDSAEELLLVHENADDPEVQQLGALMERELNDALRIVFLVLSALLCALAVGTLLLILIKMYQRTIKGHQSLGILLLCGIIALYATAFLFASAPTELICHLRLAMHALAHTLCFGVIIVKAIQLRNAETLALMGASAQQISYWNYWLLLTFIVAVQFVICLKWLLFGPFVGFWPDAASAPQRTTVFPSSASFSTSDRHVLLCAYSSPNFMLAQVYIFLLLLLALILSAQNRNIKRNYKEAKWLFITSMLCTILLSAWAVCHFLINALYLDHMSVIELHLTGTLLLAFVYGPKLYVLLFYEPVVVECVYYGDNEIEEGCLGQNQKIMHCDNSGPFESEWHHVTNSLSPTLSNRSSDEATTVVGSENANLNCRLQNQNERQSMRFGEVEDAKMTAAFQTILRKKTGSSGSGLNKMHQHYLQQSHPNRIASDNTMPSQQCSINNNNNEKEKKQHKHGKNGESNTNNNSSKTRRTAKTASSSGSSKSTGIHNSRPFSPQNV